MINKTERKEEDTKEAQSIREYIKSEIYIK